MKKLLVLALLATTLHAQTPRDTIEAHTAAAKAAAGSDHLGLFDRLCTPEPEPAAPPPARSNTAPRPSTPPAPPDPSRWAADPAKVFDNLLFVGEKEYSAWAVTTSDGIIIIDTIFEYSVDRQIAGGLTKLGKDPKTIKYAIVSHGHRDHSGGALYLQDRFNARVIMSPADWDMLAKNTRDPAKPRRDLEATDGQRLTLGDTTLTLYITPGHTPGTVSTLVPVTDNGVKHLAAAWGGTAFNFPRTVQNFDIYIASARRFRDIVTKAGADVLISNHTRFDGSPEKLAALKTRKPGERHPYVIGTDAVQRYLTVAEECARAARLRVQQTTPPPAAAILPDDEIRAILATRIDKERQGVGMVVGVLDSSGRRIIAHGARDAGDTRPLDGDTVFEIGSMTKVFTSVLLADAVQRKEVALTDPVNKFLPDAAKVPDRAGKSITLQDLAQHTSALPRLPGNMKPQDMRNPYADYSVDQLYQFLASVQLARDIGAQYEYSNLGAGLLGHVLARRAGMDYEALVRSRILDPLGMKSTSITLSSDQKARLTPGHNAQLQAVPNWDIPTLAGAGALRSTTNDMLTFLSAVLGYRKPPLADAFALTTSTRRSAAPGLDIGLGWHIFTAHGKDVVWHNGGTGGYRTFMGVDPNARVGVVILSNTSTMAGPDDIGRHLLDTESPLRTFTPSAAVPR
jgi:D-alanyl-D-alanine-carboxypeptidase/D-alanyl-D-alanine-endopeptidase